MRVFYTDIFVLPLPDGHRFPMAKYAQLRERVIADGTVQEAQLLVPDPATHEELLRVHTPEYVGAVVSGSVDEAAVRRLGFPWSPQLVERSRRSVGATVSGARAALAGGVSVNLAGGTHHAYADHGAGYCVFNDVAVAARAMQAEGRASRVLVIDCDVHQGDGTAAIFADDPSVFTFSIHGARNFPFRKARSDLDVPLPDGTNDIDYLAALREGLEEALTEFPDPDLAFYVAGADPHAGDSLGRLELTRAGLLARDELVLCTLAELGVATVVVMAGGYGAVEDVVAIHAATVAVAARSRPTGERASAALRY